MAFENAKRITTNASARVASSASGIYDDNLVLLYWENIESKFLEECINYFNDSTQRVIYTSGGTIDFFDISFTQDLYHVHAYYSESDERLYRILMKNAATTAPYTQTDTKWRTLSGRTFESGTSNLTLVMYNVNSTQINALTDESIPESVTDAIYLIGGTQLTGTWFNIRRESEFNTDTGLYDLRWFISRYNTKEYIFHSDRSSTEDRIRFFNHHLTSGGIDNFENNYYFDSSAIGQYYYSTDSKNYTKRNNAVVTDIRFATSTDAGLTNKILTWDGSTNTFNSIEGNGTLSDPSYRLNYVDVLDQWTLVKTSGDTVSTLATFNETPTPTPGDLPDVGETATFATGYTLARHDSNSTNFKNVLPTTAKRIIDPVVGRTVDYTQLPNRDTGEIDLDITIVFIKNITSSTKAAIVSPRTSQTVEVQTSKTPSELEDIGDISATDKQIVEVDIRPNADGTFTSIKRSTTSNNIDSGAKAALVSSASTESIQIQTAKTASELEAISDISVTAGEISEVSITPNPDGSFTTIKKVRTDSSLSGATLERNTGEKIIDTTVTENSTEQKFVADGGSVANPTQGESKSIENVPLPNGKFRTTITTKKLNNLTATSQQQAAPGSGGNNQINLKTTTINTAATSELSFGSGAGQEATPVEGQIKTIQNSKNIDGTFKTTVVTEHLNIDEISLGYAETNNKKIRTLTKYNLSKDQLDAFKSRLYYDDDLNIYESTTGGVTYISKNGDGSTGSIPSPRYFINTPKRGVIVNFDHVKSKDSPSYYDTVISISFSETNQSICRYANIHGQTSIIIDISMAQEVDKNTFLDTFVLDSSGNYYEGTFSGSDFNYTKQNGLSSSGTLLQENYTKFNEKKFENIVVDYRSFFNEIEKYYNYQIVATIKSSDIRLSYNSNNYISISAKDSSHIISHGSRTHQIDGSYKFIGYINGRTAWMYQRPSGTATGIWVDIDKIFGSDTSQSPTQFRIQAILISYNSLLLQWEINLVSTTRESIRDGFDLNDSGFQRLDIPPTLASSSDNSVDASDGIYGIKCYTSDAVNLANIALPPITKFSNASYEDYNQGYGAVAFANSIWKKAGYGYSSETGYDTDAGMYKNINSIAFTVINNNIDLSDGDGGILDTAKPLTYSPSRNTNITMYDYYDLTRAELDTYITFFEGQRFTTGSQCDVKHERNRDGTYTLKATVLHKLGTAFSFQVGHMKYHIANGYPQAPYTCDPGGTAPAGYYKIELTNTSADTSAEVKYNESTDTFNWIIKENTGSSKDWNAGLPSTGTSPAEEGVAGYTNYEPLKTTEVWMYMDVPYLPKDVPADFAVDADGKLKDGFGIVTTGPCAFQKYFHVKYDVEYNRQKGLYTWRKTKTTTSVPRPFYDLGFTYSDPDKLGGFYYTNFSIQYEHQSQFVKNWTFDDTGGPYVPVANDPVNSDSLWFLFLQLGRSRPIKTYTMEKNFVCIPPLAAWEAPNLTHLPDGSKITGTNINKQETLKRKSNYNFIVEKIFTVTGAWETDFTDDVIPSDMTMRSCYWNAYYGNPDFPLGLGYQPGTSPNTIPGGAKPYLANSTRRIVNLYNPNDTDDTVNPPVTGSTINSSGGANLGFSVDSNGDPVFGTL